MSIENPVIYVPISHLSSACPVRVSFTLMGSSPLYICRESSTNHLLFMQNKPNFQKAKMNANAFSTMNYKDFIPLAGQKNKPNSNPNKPNLQKAKMNVNSFITKDYRKIDDFSVRINKPNFHNAKNERKLNYNKGLQKKRLFSSPKNKPNSNPIKACPERIYTELRRSSRMGQFLQRPKSLAKKSGHTPQV